MVFAIALIDKHKPEDEVLSLEEGIGLQKINEKLEWVENRIVML